LSVRSAIEEMLREVIEHVGLLGGAVITSDGFLIAHVLPENVDGREFAAYITRLYRSCIRIAALFELNFFDCAIECEEGKLYVAPVSDRAFFCLIVDPYLDIGLLLLEIEGFARRIAQLLE